MSSKKSIVVLGGGIAGLAAAWKLRDHDVLVLEGSSRLGGWIRTIEKNGFLFETGPRSCRSYGNGGATLKLIRELGLADDILPADPAAQIRYLFHNKKLTRIPGLAGMLFSPFLPIIFRGIVLDVTTASIHDDCSIAEFIEKRLGKDLLDVFISPLVSGVYAGTAESLSIEATFSSLYQLQKTHGSLLKGMILSGFKGKSQEPFPLFTLKNGLESLVKRLGERLGPSRIRLNASVVSVKQVGRGWQVGLENGEVIECEKVISTLPGKGLEKFWGFKATPASTVAVVNLGYHSIDLPLNGFGYLIPSKEKEQVLGVVWDSKVFPGQQLDKRQGRLTVMIGGTGAPEGWRSWDFVAVALEAINRQMGVTALPDVTHVSIAENAIPQFEVGYSSRLRDFLNHIRLNHPGLEMGGACIDGVAINECIHGADRFTKIGIQS